MGELKGLTIPFFSKKPIETEGNVPIQIKSSTYDRLKAYKKDGESFDAVLRRIIGEWEITSAK